jgi:hypothetical protein
VKENFHSAKGIRGIIDFCDLSERMGWSVNLKQIYSAVSSVASIWTDIFF